MMTFNSRGYKPDAYKELLLQKDDILCVQECGNMGPMAQRCELYYDDPDPYFDHGYEGSDDFYDEERFEELEYDDTDYNFDNEDPDGGGTIYYDDTEDYQDFTKGVINLRTSTRPIFVSFFNWHNTSAGNPRCSLVIFARHPNQEEIEFYFELKVDYLYPLKEEWHEVGVRVRNRPRPLLLINYESALITTCHCPASGNAESVRDLYAHFLCENCLEYNWMMIGDFNCAPEWSESAYRYFEDRAEIVSPDIRTHTGGNIIDYMIKHIDTPAYYAEVLDNNYYSDHYPVKFKQ